MRAGPIKSRLLPYAEMMNGGRQQLDQVDHALEQELRQRVESLEKNVRWLEQVFVLESTNSIPLDRAVSSLHSGRACPRQGAVQPTFLGRRGRRPLGRRPCSTRSPLERR